MMGATIGTLPSNSRSLREDSFFGFEPKTGYFGDKKPGNEANVRVIQTDGDPMELAKSTFNQLSLGGQLYSDDGNRITYILQDGAYITIRRITKSGPPAVEISVKRVKDTAGIKSQKIHFIKKG